MDQIKLFKSEDCKIIFAIGIQQCVECVWNGTVVLVEHQPPPGSWYEDNIGE